MPEIIPYSLTFQGGLHLGKRGVDLEDTGVSIPADTLFSALLDAWRRLGGDPADFAQPFCQNPPDPPFLLSSAFPFAGKVRFYPLPTDLSRCFSAGVLQARSKDLKGIQFFSEELLRMALEGRLLDEQLYPESEAIEPERGVALQGGRLWLTVDEAKRLPEAFQRDEKRPRPLRSLRFLRLWAEQRTPRVSVDRLSSATNIYHTGRVVYAPDCGLWFGVGWRDVERTLGQQNVTFRAAFCQAMNALQEEGLGGERAVGYGAFQLKQQEKLRLPDPRPGQLAYLLSRYHPRPDELPAALTGQGAAFALVAVGGWLRSPDGPSQRRKRLMLVREGSLVLASESPAGDLVDIGPTYANPQGDLPHPVYRYGLALAAGWPAN